jgi:hypothetical protein
LFIVSLSSELMSNSIPFIRRPSCRSGCATK